MAEKQVVRQDVVQITWDVADSPFKKLANESKKFQSTAGKAVGTTESNFGKLSKSVQNLHKNQKKLTGAANESSKSFERLKNDIDQANAALAKVKATADAVKARLKAMGQEISSALSKIRADAMLKLTAATNKFKSVIHSLNPVSVFNRMKTAVMQNIAAFKTLSKQKLTALTSSIKSTINFLTEGKTGAAGFKTALKNVAKIGFSETVNGIRRVGTGLKSAITSVKSFGTNLKTSVKTGFQSGIASARKFLETVKKIDKEKFKQLLTGVNNLTKKIGSSLVSAAKKAAKAVATIGAGVGAGAFKLADMASDLNETINKVDVSFGDSSNAVKEWSKTSIKNMGMAQQTALDMAAGYGDMGTSMGLTQSAAADMSMELTKRAADLSSFKNMELDEVNTALNGVFTGETESLKRLGVVMTQTNLEAFAQQQGKAFESMSESEKVMLRYQYVMEKTSNAQDDFIRTGGGFANQLRMAKEQLKQIGTTIGGVFIGSFENVLNKVNEFGTRLNEKLSTVFADGFQFGDIAKIAPMLGPVGTVIQNIANKIRAVTSNNEKMAMIKNLFSAIGTAAGRVAGFVGNLASKVMDFVTSAGFLKTVKAIVGGVGRVFGFLSKHMNTIVEIVVPLAAGIATVVGVVKAVSGAMKVWSAVQWVLNSGLLACPITWVVLGIGALVAIIVVVVRHWDKLKAAALNCWNKIKAVWSKVSGWFNSKVIQPVKGFFQSLWAKVPEPVKDVIGKIADGFQWAYDKVTSAWSGIVDFFKGIWADVVSAVEKPVNKLIDGANWVLDKVGSDKQFDPWKPYANGTNGHPGGNAIVNDGRGAELVQMPNGMAFIPRGRNVLLPNAPKGMKVLDAERTAQVMGKSRPTFNYEKGTGGWISDVFDFFDDAGGLVGKVVEKFVSFKDMSGVSLDVGKGLINTAKGEMVDWVKGLFDKFGGKSIEGYEPSKGVEQWRSTVVNALKMEGLNTADNVKRTLFQMQTESGGNPKAINRWDSNAKKGTPSKGLMQVIDPTFKAYARKGYNKNIYDPMSNILASVRYAKSRYGSLAKAYRGVGYANGIGIQTISLPAYSPSSSVPRSNSTTNNNNYSPAFTLNMSGTVDRTTERTIKQWVKEAIDEMLESMSRTSPRLTEV